MRSVKHTHTHTLGHRGSNLARPSEASPCPEQRDRRNQAFWCLLPWWSGGSSPSPGPRFRLFGSESRDAARTALPAAALLFSATGVNFSLLEYFCPLHTSLFLSCISNVAVSPTRSVHAALCRFFFETGCILLWLLAEKTTG